MKARWGGEHEVRSFFDFKDERIKRSICVGYFVS